MAPKPKKWPKYFQNIKKKKGIRSKYPQDLKNHEPPKSKKRLKPVKLTNIPLEPKKWPNTLET